LIRGNFIGTDATGLTPMPNKIGIEVHGDGNVIGGPSPLDRNVISGNEQFGILVESIGNVAHGNIIWNNSIGVNALGTVNVGNGSDGIRLHSAQGTLIGGVSPTEQNLIGANHGAGIATLSFGSIPTDANSFIGNRIFNNDGLGIDLGPSGVNPNDQCDADGGDHRGQNYPDITLVSSFGGNTRAEWRAQQNFCTAFLQGGA
jgi:hypothetical protein